MKELATRHALGAGIGRIARAAADRNGRAHHASAARSACGSDGLASRTLRAPSGSSDTPQGTAVALDARVVGFTLALVAAVGVLDRAGAGARRCAVSI